MNRLLFLSLLTYLLLLVGLGAVNGGIVALALPLVAYLAAVLLRAPEPLQLRVERTLTSLRFSRTGEEPDEIAVDRVMRNTPVAVTLTVTNEGGRVEELLIEDLLPPGLEILEGEPVLLTPLDAGESVTLRYTVQGARGSFNFGEVHMTARESLGLFRREAQPTAPARLLILPEVSRLRRIPIHPLHTHGFAGPIPSGQPGSGVDFYGVREYQMGDSRRQINWRVTARHGGRPFTNQYEQERIADVGIILDARQQSNVQVNGDSLFEHAIGATASLADAFLAEGHRVALIVYGRTLERIYPGYGKVQRERILRALAEARMGDSLVFETFDYLPTRFFPARSQIVIVSPLQPADLPMLIRLRARGYHLLVVSPNPIAFEVEHLEPTGEREMGARIARVARALLLARLRRVGISVVDWQVERSLDRVIHTSLARGVQGAQAPRGRT